MLRSGFRVSVGGYVEVRIKGLRLRFKLKNFRSLVALRHGEVQRDLTHLQQLGFGV